MPNRVHGAFYALTAVPIVIGIVVAVVSILRMVDDIEAMPRLVIPGERDVELEAGEYIVYGETKSVVDGRGISVTSFQATCRLTGPDGADVAMETRSSTSSYALGSYKGESMFEVDVPAAGTYHLACDGDTGVIALGGGIGKTILIALGAGFVGIGLGIAVFFLVRGRRKRGWY